MRRRYDSAAFARLVEHIRSQVPGMAIWTDVIAGFPGETDEDFEQSYRFIEDMDFAGIHVFRYSPRTGTKAATMDAQGGFSSTGANAWTPLAAGSMAGDYTITMSAAGTKNATL